MGGGYSAPHPSYNRTPSMSRSSAPRAAQPRSTPIQRQGGPARPNAAGGQRRPTAGGQRGPTAGGPRTASPAGRSSFQSPSSFQRPSQQQLGNFLNLPAGSSGARGPSQVAQSPGRAAAQGGGEGPRTVEGPRGGSVTVGRGSGSTTTPGGVTVGGGGAGVKVEGPRGNTAVKGAGGVGASNGELAGAKTGAGKAVQGPGGNTAAAGVGRKGITDGTNTVAGRGAAAGVRGPGGATRGRAAGTIGATDGTRTQVRQGAAVRGPGGNTISAGRGANFVNGQFVGGANWSRVNGAYHHWNAFGPGWYGRYPGAWWPGKWAVRATAWTAAAWAVAGPYAGCSGDGNYYDYSENVTYQDGEVYYGDEAVATSEEYYDQAGEIAAAGETPQNEEWMPLGVFSVLTTEGQSQTDKAIQLAINKDGIIRGNFQDFLTEKVTPITGSVDKETQRVAFRAEGNDSVVIETGLYNLTNDEVPVLVHFDKDQQQQRLLVRLDKPEEAEGSTPN